MQHQIKTFQDLYNMSNYLNIPKVLPFKFLPNTATPGIHFDDDWACEQIRFHERRVYYSQKWLRSYTTKLQITTTIEPESLKLLDSNGVTVKTFAWTIAGVGANGEKAYECTYDVTDIAVDGYYYLYLKCELLSVKFEAVSEPIFIKDYHRNVRPWVYSHSENDFGMVWTTGIQMTFMCESDIPPTSYRPDRDRSSYVNQTHDVATVQAYPFQVAKLYIGETKGVAPYIPDIANRILCCDKVKFAGLQIETPENGKFDVNSVNGYPLVGASIDVMPARNLDSLQLLTEDLIPGVVTTYNLNTNFFGSANIIHITEIETL